MEKPRVFKLPLSEGVQTIRLDEDSLDYDWKGSFEDFHGMLPYENLRIKSRVTRRARSHGKAAVIVALLGALLFPLVVRFAAPYLIAPYVVVVIQLAGYLAFQHFRGGTVCVQIEPQPFGFRGELPIPDTKAGQAFLKELEEAWEESLRRRFLVRDGVDPWLQLRRIDWLEFIGILTSEEAATERSLIDTDGAPEQKMLPAFAVN
jgi:hypothetical protein